MNIQSNTEQFKKLRELVEGINIAMLTTLNEEGRLHARPMATQEMKSDGELWFFTQASSHKVEELRANPHVNVTYSNPEKQRYVSISGEAELVRDQKKNKELWNPAYRAWFPKGLDDPDLSLLCVQIDQAEYWDVPSSTMVHLIGAAKAMLTGKPYDPADHAKMAFKH